MAKIASIHSSGNAAGTIIPCGNSTALPRTLLCNGSAVSRPIASGGTTDMYKALYEAIGTTYGIGDGSTTFNIPDTRGIFLRGAGTNLNNANNTATLGGRQLDNNKSHGHSIPRGGGSGFVPYLGEGIYAAGASNITFSFTTASDGTTEARPANVGVNYCIAY
jgi:hypothetical protein